MVESGRFHQLQRDMDRVQAFAVGGDLSPDLPGDQVRALAQEYEETALRLGEHFISVLTSESVADLLLTSQGLRERTIFREIFWGWAGDRRVVEPPYHQGLVINLVPGSVHLKIYNNGDLRHLGYNWAHPGFLPKFYPAEPGNNWYTPRYPESDNFAVPDNTKKGKYLKFRLGFMRRLQSQDFVVDPRLFVGFLNGSTGCFRVANEELDRRAKETQELSGALEAGKLASQLLMF